ncbi:von Willebrand factor A domain-containing protein 5A [Tritrichomonas musculus]|uniref:von Willebrand factor A domain-containing protein 5A n=1 Tax=Tritrichomonas musculus TaxID=1915356 RepID=A0ABR2L0Z2_9EUKA
MTLGLFYFKKWDSLINIKPKSLKIKGFQKGFINDLEIYQSIEVNSDMEQVSYVLPTDNKLCIYNMKFQIGDQIIPAEIKTEKEAKEIFQSAKKAKKTAALAEQIGPDLISIKIGNVLKDTNVAIILKCAFISTLQNPKSILTKIPLQVCQFDGTIRDLFKIPSVEIDFEMTISQMSKISEVTTNCESKYENIDDFNGKISFNSPFMNESNILISTNFSEKIESQIITTKKASLISYIPNFEPKINKNKEYVFLIDCSTSMIGGPIKRAKEVLLSYISQLPKECYFNIILFGNYHKKLFEHSTINNEQNNSNAITFINAEMKAKFGSSDMYSVLDKLFKNDIKIGLQRQIVLITDGEVYQREKTVSLIEKNKKLNRFFSIGLGLGTDGGFLNEIAEITNGKSDYIFSKEDLPERIHQHLRLSQMDPVTDAQIHISGEESFQISPTPFPHFFPNVLQSIFIIGENKKQNDVLITLKLNDNEKQEEVENIIPLKDDWENNAAIFALYAQNKLKESQNDKDKSIRISLESGVLSRYTSYVAVSRLSYIQEPQEKEQEDNYRAHAYGDDKEDNEYSESEMILQLLKDNVVLWKSEVIEEMRKNNEIGPDVEYDDIFKNDIEAYHKKITASELDGIKLLNKGISQEEKEEENNIVFDTNITPIDIMRLQKVDGFWDLPSAFIYEKTGGKIPEIDIDFSEMSPIIKKRVISTIFCLCYLFKFNKENINKWNFEKEKSLKWLNKISSTLNWDTLIESNIPNIIQ